MHKFISFLRVFSLFPGLIFGISSTGPGYTLRAGLNHGIIYRFDPDNPGPATPILTIPTPGVYLSDIALANKSTAYVTDYALGLIYRVNLDELTYRTITPSPIAAPFQLVAIGLVDDKTAIVCDQNDQKVYSVNLESGAASYLTTVPISPGNFLGDLAIANRTTVYLETFDGFVYALNLQNGELKNLTPTPSPSMAQISGIDLANNSIAYLVGYGDDNVYALNVETGEYSLITPAPFGTPGASLPVNLGLNETNGFTVGIGNGVIYSINLQTGASIALSSVPGIVLNGMGLLLQMPTRSLTGNNLNFAKYLNANAPIDVIRSFALLSNGLAAALEAAAPTRNTFPTYASQNGYLASSQTVTDHMRQRKFNSLMAAYDQIALSELPAQNLLVDASENSLRSKTENCCEKYTGWISPFGEYAKERAQHQTPDFNMKLGGVVAAIDYKTVGIGGAYVYTNVHEGEKAGHANVNQGYLTVYGSFNRGNWHADAGLWGGYYSSSNQRNIVFHGVNEKAKSDIHGWQLAPHLEIGYDWSYNCVNWFGIEPFLMGDWVANWEGGFKEHGAGRYNMGQKGRFCSLLRGETGFRFHEIVKLNGGRLVFREKGSYAYQKTFHTGSITAFLAGSPGSFTVSTLTGAQNLGVVELSMLYISDNCKVPYIDIRYQGELGSRYQSHQGMIEVGKNF